MNRTSDSAFITTRLQDGRVAGEFSLPAGSSLATLLHNVASGESGQCVAYGDVPCEQYGAVDDADGLFLTVVMRTQGNRIEELKDVLLCLSAQISRNFEVILVGHKVSEARKDAVREVLDLYAPLLDHGIRCCFVETGERATPLQVGFTLARASYVAALDDDDLVMDTWVSSFEELAENNYGKILHTYAVMQDWYVDKDADAAGGLLRAGSSFDSQFCKEFDAGAQLTANSCPLMALAFPAFVYQDLNIKFDNSMTTTEDWDFLMRVYSVCGVVTRGSVTAIYRQWKNAATSHTQHDSGEWNDNYNRIVDKLTSAPFLVGQESVESFRLHCSGAQVGRSTLVQTARLLRYEADEPASRVLRDMELMRATKPVKTAVGVTEPHRAPGVWDCVFEFDDPQPVGMVAFTPVKKSFVVVGEFELCLEQQDGTEVKLDFSNLAYTNGYQVDCNHIVFLKEHPFVSFKVESDAPIAKVRVRTQILGTVPDYYIDQIVQGPASLMIGRARRWFKRRLQR